MRKIISTARIFDGDTWLEEKAIVIENEKIKEILPLADAGDKVEVLRSGFIVPGFVDAQVYGAGGKLLSAYPEAATLQVMHDEFLKQGTVLCLPTVSTNTIPVFKQCIDAIRTYWSKGGEGIWGIHLEGPWLNVEKRGAHRAEWIHVPTEVEVRDILEYGKDVIKMITLAPENCSPDIIDLILSYNVIIAAGHSNATYEQANEGFERGIHTATHLYNAMSALAHRAPGLAGATLNHHKAAASIIPDGYHVHFAAVAIAKKIMKERLFAITDAVTETKTGPYQHYLNGEKYESDGILSGSALSMRKAFHNLVEKVGIEVDEALRMCSLYPAKLLRADRLYGRIAPGYSGKVTTIES